MSEITKIDLYEWAKVDLVHLHLDKNDMRQLNNEERDEVYTEIGNKYSFCRWLKEKGYLKEGVEV